MPDTADKFSEKMTAILNYGALNLALAIGYRLGLFDTAIDGRDCTKSRPESTVCEGMVLTNPDIKVI